MSETITADHLNATHLGKKIIILDNCEIVMSGKLKELRTTQYSMPVYSNDIEAVPNGYGNITIAPKLNYETVTDIIIFFGLRRPCPLGRGGSKPSSFHRLI